MTEVPSVDVLIAQQRAKKKALKRIKFKRFLISFLLLLVLVGSGYVVIRFDYFAIKKIDVTGNRVLKSTYLQEILWSNTQSMMTLSLIIQI